MFLTKPQKIINLFFPNICYGCEKELVSNENGICLKCLYFFPKTNFHLQNNNPFEKKFWGRIKIEFATSMYYFNKGGVIQKLFHQLKYNNKQEVGTLLGSYFAREIEHVLQNKNIDVIIPIPLSRQKLKSRGYNQCDSIANSIAELLNIKIDLTSIIRKKNTYSQTRKKRIDRLDNVEEAFEVINLSAFENKHILLVDDVVTTGATLESCASTILNIPNAKISIVTLAYAVE